MRDRVRIDTGSKAPSAAGGSSWSTSSSETWPMEWISFPAEKRERYQSLDCVVTGEMQFHGAPTITMGGTRFVWLTKGHPWYMKILWPVSASDNVDGVGRVTSVVVRDSGETADE